jgi:hypothetical protein
MAQVLDMYQTYGLSDVVGKWFLLDLASETSIVKIPNEIDSQSKVVIQDIVNNYLNVLGDPEIIKSLSMVQEQLDGASVYHLRFAPTDSVLDTLWTKYVMKYSKESGIDVSNYKLSDWIKGFTSDLWMGKSEYYIHKFGLKFDLTNPYYFAQTQPLSSSDSASISINKNKVPVSLTVKFSDFGKPVTVETPSDALNFSDFITTSMEEAASRSATISAYTQFP